MKTLNWKLASLPSSIKSGHFSHRFRRKGICTINFADLAQQCIIEWMESNNQRNYKKIFSPFYLIWVLTVFSFASLGYFGNIFNLLKANPVSVGIWSLLTLVVVLPPLFFNRLLYKLLISEGLLSVIYFFLVMQESSTCFAGCWGLLGFYIVAPVVLIIFAILILIEHSRNIYVSLPILLVFFSASYYYGVSQDKYNNGLETVRNISAGQYSTATDAENQCSILSDDQLQSNCFAELAFREGSSVICDKISGSPGYPKGQHISSCKYNVYWKIFKGDVSVCDSITDKDVLQICVLNVAIDTRNLNLCSDERITSLVSRDRCFQYTQNP